MIPGSLQEFLDAAQRADHYDAWRRRVGIPVPTLDEELTELAARSRAASSDLQKQLVVDWLRAEPWAMPGYANWLTRDMKDGPRRRLRVER